MNTHMNSVMGRTGASAETGLSGDISMPGAEDRTLKRLVTSESQNDLIMDLFQSNREMSSEMDVSDLNSAETYSKQNLFIEDRSLKRKPSGSQSMKLLMESALQGGHSLSDLMAPPSQTPIDEDNFVLEWAYSVDPEDWDKLGQSMALPPDAAGSQGQLQAITARNRTDVKMEVKGETDEFDRPERNDGDDDDEYIPGAGDGHAGGRKRRASARSADKDEELRDDESKKRKTTWRKYGQKVLKGKDFVGMDVIRCYFRCSVPGCKVKKQVEKASWQTNAEASVRVTGIHSHPYQEESISEDEGDGATAGEPRESAIEASRFRRTRDPQPIPPLNKNLSNEIRDSSPHFVISDPTRPDSPIIFASPGFCRLTGYSVDECVGRNCRFLQGKDSNPNAIKQISMACKLQKEIRVILLNYKKDGAPFWNLLHITPVKDREGNLISYVGVQMDVSERFPSL